MLRLRTDLREHASTDTYLNKLKYSHENTLRNGFPKHAKMEQTAPAAAFLSMCSVYLTANVGKVILDFSHGRWLCAFCQVIHRLHSFLSKNVVHSYPRSGSARMERNGVYTHESQSVNRCSYRLLYNRRPLFMRYIKEFQCVV